MSIFNIIIQKWILNADIYKLGRRRPKILCPGRHNPKLTPGYNIPRQTMIRMWHEIEINELLEPITNYRKYFC